MADAVAAVLRDHTHTEHAHVLEDRPLERRDVAPAGDATVHQRDEVRQVALAIALDESAHALDGRAFEERQVPALTRDAVDGGSEAFDVLVGDGYDLVFHGFRSIGPSRRLARRMP